MEDDKKNTPEDQTPEVKPTVDPAKTTETSEVKPDVKPPEEETGDLSDFLKVKGVEEFVPENKKPADDKKPDDKKPEDKKPADDKKSDDKPIEKPTDKKPDDKTDARDYTGVDDKVVPLLKRMSNEAFNHFKPLAIEHEKIKQELAGVKLENDNLKKGIVKIPENYNAHPRGYTLTQDYEKAATNLILSEQIFNHWNSQLEAVRAGTVDVVKEITLNKETGQLEISREVKVDANTPAQLLNLVRHAQTQMAKFDAKVQSISESHKMSYENSVKAVKEFENNAFAQFRNLSGDDAKAFDLVLKDTISKVLPPAFHEDPLAPVVAKCLMTIRQMKSLLEEATKNVPKKDDTTEKQTDDKKLVDKKVDDDHRRAGPNSTDISGDGGGGAKKEDEVSYDDFLAMKRG